jgi:acetyl-CoA carboxylase / biotin carboxylase 1
MYMGNNGTDMNHIFINFSQTLPLEPKEVEERLSGFLNRFGFRAWRLRVTVVEVRMVCTNPHTNEPVPIRVIISNTSGFVAEVEMYEERTPVKGTGEWIFESISSSKKGAMHLHSIFTPYETKGALQPKRFNAHQLGTQYIYDFPELFRQAIENDWRKFALSFPQAEKMMPKQGECIESSELVLDEHDEVIEVNREPGTNTIGMVAWIMTAKTPEYPKGRQFIVIANDITFKIGSFGPKEDLFFKKCSELSRKLGIP